MDREGERVGDPAAHQPNKTELLEDMRADTAPEVLASAMTLCETE